MKKRMSLMAVCCLLLGLNSMVMAGDAAAAKPTYKIAWTIYAGSMPLAYAQDSVILQKWGDKYGFNIEAVQMNDYIEAQTQFSLGAFAGSIAMSLDALTIPAASGMDTTVVLPLSASMGSDGIVLLGKGKTLADLKGKSINLVELSGSHYLLARALDSVGLRESDVRIINTSDSDIGALFVDKSTQAVATWKPQLSGILAQFDDVSVVLDSSQIPNELVDVLMVQTQLLAKEPNLGKALVGAWYEALAAMNPAHPQHKQFMAQSAAVLNADERSLLDQFSTIGFYNPTTAAEYVSSASFKTKMTDMAEFAFDHGLFEGASSPDFVGIEAGDGKVFGNSANVKLRFPARWLQAAEGAAP